MAGLQLKALLQRLDDQNTYRNISLLRTSVHEILQLVQSGSAVEPALLAAIVKLLAHPDVFVKRVTGEILSTVAPANPDIALLATNTLVQDSYDVNPVIRSLSLRTLSSIQQKSCAELLSSAVSQGLEDKSSYVRHSAALAVPNLMNLSPSLVKDGEIWDMLYRHLADQDGMVVAACLVALEEVFSDEAGVVLSNKLGQHLVTSLHNFSTPVQRVLLQFLMKFSPKSKTQVFEYLNILDPYLTQNSDLTVTLSCFEVFTHLTDDIPKVKLKAYKASWSTIKKHLQREKNKECVSALIDYLTLSDFPPSVCQGDFNKFFCKDDDPHYLLHKKVGFLCKLLSEENADQILQELLSFSRRCPTVVGDMINCLAKVSYKKAQLEEKFSTFITKLLHMDNDHILHCVVERLPAVRLRCSSSWEPVIECLCQQYGKVKSFQARVSFLDVIGLVGVNNDLTGDILCYIFQEWLGGMEAVNNRISAIEESGGGDSKLSDSLLANKVGNLSASTDTSPDDLQQIWPLKLACLTAMVNCCLRWPAQLQLPLSRLMEECGGSPDRSVRERAHFLYLSLLSDVSAKQMIESKIEV